MGENLGGGRNRHHATSISKHLNTISDSNVLESTKHLDPLGIFSGGEKADFENQVGHGTKHFFRIISVFFLLQLKTQIFTYYNESLK